MNRFYIRIIRNGQASEHGTGIYIPELNRFILSRCLAIGAGVEYELSADGIEYRKILKYSADLIPLQGCTVSEIEPFVYRLEVQNKG
jgi:hypothetical protein